MNAFALDPNPPIAHRLFRDGYGLGAIHLADNELVETTFGDVVEEVVEDGEQALLKNLGVPLAFSI
jgi:hypothetical protein